MEENYCPVCGEETTTETTSNATNTGRFVKEPEFAKVFQCFNRIFEVKDPPWFEKAFVFCSECCRQLTVVSELEEVMKEVERRLKESEKVVQDKLTSSENKFQLSGVYGRDKRYWKVREQYLKTNGGTQGREPELGSSTIVSLLASQEKQPEYVSVEVNPSVAEDFLDESEVADAQHPHSGVQPENPVPRPRRHRAPPKRFNPDEVYTSKKKKRDEASIETGRRITSIPKDVHQTIKVEEGEEEELYQILDEMMCPNAPQNVSAPSSQSSSMTFTTDPLAFAQQLDGGVVEYIKVEVTPEDDTLTSSQNPKVKNLPRILRKSTQRARLSDFNAPTGLLNVPSNSPRKDVNLPSLEKVKTRVRKELPVLPTCDVCADRFAEKSLLDTHIVEVHESQENYDKLVTEKVKEAELRWGTPGKPVVTHFGIRLDKIGNGKQYQCSACDAIVPITQSNPGTQPRQHVVQYHTDFCKCTVCGKKFGNNTDLQRHVTQVHQGILTTKTKKYECSVCLKPLWSNNQVTFHMWSHYNQEERVAALARGEKRPKPPKRKIECTKCIKKFFKEEELQRHMNFAHNPSTHRQEIVKVDESTFLFHSVTLSKVFGGEKYKCSACDSILETMKAAKSHVIGAHTRFYKCDQCEKRFPYPKSLQMHLESTHKQGSTTYCPTCEKPFVGKKPPRDHLWTHYSEEEKQEAVARGEKVPHMIVNRYQCDQCTSSFTCNADLRRHQKTAHEGVPQEKKICGVCGAAVLSLLSHMKHSHPKEEDFRFICSVCDMKFAMYNRLKRHKLVRHGIGQKLKCDLCPKEYVTKVELEAHRNKHLNIRPYKCPKCPMAFTRAEVLKKHNLYKHEGVKCPPSRPRKKQMVAEVETSESDSD